MKNECNIVRDILPLYSEGMVSEDTASFVKEHLDGCAECKAEFDALHQANELVSTDTEDVRVRSREILPLKLVKRKLRRGRLLTVIASVVITALVIGLCVRQTQVKIDYGSSELYSNEEMDDAIDLICDKIDSWVGVKLYSVSYAYDDWCVEELAKINEGTDHADYTECIVFRSHFRTPFWAGGAWMANTDYYWNWYLVRIDDGPWQLHGYGAG